MTTTWACCEGAFIGHALASSCDPSVSMALNVAESLLQRRQFDGPDILSKHLYLYHRDRCEIGQITKCVYEEACKRIGTRGTITAQHFLFDQPTIDSLVKAADATSGGHTAGCGPAQRSYPLAFCMYITDDDLAEATMDEAKLTHHSPLAGQVAVIVNLICRSLIRGKSWHEAVADAFTTPKIHGDIVRVSGHHRRWAQLSDKSHPSYAPGALNTALHYVAASKDATEAIKAAKTEGNSAFCIPIIGILAGARWGIPETMYKEHADRPLMKAARETASKLSNLWSTNLGDVST